MSAGNYTIVSIFFDADRAQQLLQCRSLARFGSSNEFVKRFIIIDNSELKNDSFHSSLRAELSSIEDRTLILKSSDLAPAESTHGYVSQQFLKLIVSSIVTTPRYVVLDAKMHLTSDLLPSFFEGDTGIPRLLFENYSNHSMQPSLVNSLKYFELQDDSNE